MNLLLISRYGDGVAVLHRLMAEGHDAAMFVQQQPAMNRLFDGLAEQLPCLPADMPDRDLVLFDAAGGGSTAEWLASQGLRVYGASPLGDCLQGDTAFLLKVAKAAGVLVPECAPCADLDQVREFVGETPRLCVFRPASSLAERWVFSPRDLAEQEAFLNDCTRPDGPRPMVVEQAVGGIEVTIGCFYHNGQPIEATIHSAIELTRAMAQGVGPQTAGAGCVAWFWRNRHNKLWRLTHERLSGFLSRNRYTGPLTLRVCVPDAGEHLPVLVSAVCQLSYPTFHALCGGLGGLDLAAFLDGLTTGSVDLHPSHEWLGAVRVTIPPYPNPVDASVGAGRTIGGVDPADADFWPMDVMASESGYVTAGCDGVVCDLTARARTLAELDTSLYRRARALTLLDKQYRSDVVSSATDRLWQLEAWKYINMTE